MQYSKAWLILPPKPCVRRFSLVWFYEIALRGKRFESNTGVKAAVQIWFGQQGEINIVFDGITNLIQSLGYVYKYSGGLC